MFKRNLNFASSKTKRIVKLTSDEMKKILRILESSIDSLDFLLHYYQASHKSSSFSSSQKQTSAENIGFCFDDDREETSDTDTHMNY